MTAMKTSSKNSKKNGGKASKKASTKSGTEYSPRELELATAYLHQRLVAGSWRHAGHPDRPGLGAKKATVVVTCKACDKERIVCTSDLQWATTAYCRDTCAKDVKKNRRATKAEKKAQ